MGEMAAAATVASTPSVVSFEANFILVSFFLRIFFNRGLPCGHTHYDESLCSNVPHCQVISKRVHAKDLLFQTLEFASVFDIKMARFVHLLGFISG